MERYLCIHGHFYQPPRENPWLDEIEIQETARPHKNWNERISAECYRANAFARILNPQKQIIDIVNNYSKISFNFGPTLLSWLEKYDSVTLFKSVRGKNGFAHKIRMGEYVMFDGDNSC